MRVLTYIVALMLLSAGSAKAEDIMQWDRNFDAIVLGNITRQSDVSEGSSTATLFISGDAEISAQQSAAAQLSNGTDVLMTEYKLSFDGGGSGNDSGAAGTDYVTFDQFLATPLAVRHMPGDDEVQITLWVKANGNAGTSNEVPDSGVYNAEQTLTITWVGP